MGCLICCCKKKTKTPLAEHAVREEAISDLEQGQKSQTLQDPPPEPGSSSTSKKNIQSVPSGEFDEEGDRFFSTVMSPSDLEKQQPSPLESKSHPL
jgi:hypothetical protein